MFLGPKDLLMLERIIGAIMLLPRDQQPIKRFNRSEVVRWLIRDKAAALGLSEPNT
jgi:hypothetical protein